MDKLRKFQWDTLELDQDFKVDETAEYLFIQPVTVAREGVFSYPDGKAFKPGDELSRAAEVSRMYICWDHPPGQIVTNRGQIIGHVEGVHIEKDSKGVKVRSILIFHKKKLTEDQRELIRSGARRDVSTGFYYEEDRTPGTWNGQPYDYVQRDMLFDHVASVDHGRCSYPNCGIGADTLLSQSHEQNKGDEVMKLDPTEANLRTAESEDPSCRTCINFRSTNECVIIEGPVSANTLCDKHTPFPKPAHIDKELNPQRKESISRPAIPCLIKQLTAMNCQELVSLHQRIHRAEDYDPDSRLHKAVLFALRKKRVIGRR